MLGKQTGWSLEAATLGAEIFLKRERQGDWHPPADGVCFAGQVLESVIRQSGHAVFASAIAEDEELDPSEWGKLGQRMVDRALTGESKSPYLIEMKLRLTRPLVAIGAPSATYYPEVAKRLGTQLVIPAHAAVSNAVGAVASGVVQTSEALITQPSQGRFRLHLTSGVEDFAELDAAVARGTTAVEERASALAHRAGAAEVQLSVDRKDKVVRERGGFEIFIESRIAATAFGRPRFAG
jgi:N-methylhydantoinase A/oxoprolinase/acetone carboxylase beta subunit